MRTRHHVSYCMWGRSAASSNIAPPCWWTTVGWVTHWDRLSNLQSALYKTTLMFVTHLDQPYCIQSVTMQPKKNRINHSVIFSCIIYTNNEKQNQASAKMGTLQDCLVLKMWNNSRLWDKIWDSLYYCVECYYITYLWYSVVMEGKPCFLTLLGAMTPAFKFANTNEHLWTFANNFLSASSFFFVFATIFEGNSPWTWTCTDMDGDLPLMWRVNAKIVQIFTSKEKCLPKSFTNLNVPL